MIKNSCVLQNFINTLKQRDASINELKALINSAKELDCLRNEIENIDLVLNYFHSLGLNLDIENDKISLHDLKEKIKDISFCFVDIETTGPNLLAHKIIEIGAIKMQNQRVVDSFKTFIFAEVVPEKIEELTGIKSIDLLNAPKQKEALAKFKNFLGDSIFVAHDVRFDYDFLSNSLYKCNLGVLANLRLCTLSLAKKQIKGKYHSLLFLNKLLNINHKTIHRAYDDAFIGMEVFNCITKNIDQNITLKEFLKLF